MKSLFAAIILVLASLSAIAQSNIIYNNEYINHIDDKGNKQGVWKLFDEKRKLEVITEFKDGAPITSTKYYIESILAGETTIDNEIILYIDGDTLQVKYEKMDNEKKGRWINQNNIELTDKQRELLKSFFQIGPLYYGGSEALYDLLLKNVDRKKYKKEKGRVEVKFMLNANGVPTDFSVESSTNEKLNEEAIRVAKLMERWQPGMQNGKYVRVTLTLPFAF